MISVGDMALDMVLRTRQAQIKGDIQVHAEEVTTGIASDLPQHLSGDLGALLSIETSLGALGSYKTVTREAQLTAGTMQRVVDQARTDTTELATNMLATHMRSNADSLRALGEAAGQIFQSTVSGLNSRVAGRALFAGTETKGAALNEGNVMLSDLSAAVAGSVTAADVDAVLDAWFGAGGGFETTGYLGSTDDLAPLRISESTTVTFDLRADDELFRDVLKNLARAALAVDDSLGLSVGTQNALMDSSGNGLLAASASLTEAQSQLGAQEGRIAQTLSEVESQTTALQMARTRLVEVDSFAAATALEQTQFQLESIYAVTARLSRLSLADYIR